jgi:hypothetical protein
MMCCYSYCFASAMLGMDTGAVGNDKHSCARDRPWGNWEDSEDELVCELAALPALSVGMNESS